MIEIPDFICLIGDEDCDVLAACHHESHNIGASRANYAEIAYYYGGEGPPYTISVPLFKRNDVAGFFGAIIEHAKTHTEVK
jgi:hypothetical protein